MNNFELVMKAKIDNLYDGDVMQNVKLLGMVVTNGKMSKSSELHSLEVINAGLEKGVFSPRKNKYIEHLIDKGKIY